MGMGRWTSSDWDGYSADNLVGKSATQVFSSSAMLPEFDPRHIGMRESRDSAANPRSRPIVLGCDVTASMGMVAETVVRHGLNDIATELKREAEIGDPHVMVMAIGDATCDVAPLQVTQFEADVRIADQTSRLWIEKGGGINSGESYALAHLFAARKISADAFKRGKKGFLFTIGDEPPIGVTVRQARDVLGIDIPSDLSAAQCATLAAADWNVYHVVLLNEGFAGNGGREAVLRAWERVLPQRLILLDDIAMLSESILAAMRIAEGRAKTSVSKSVVVANAVSALAENGQTARGVARLN